MSTLKSSSENLTLNADGANNDIKFQSNGSEVAQIDQAGVISSTGGSTHADNVKAKFGNDNELEIYSDGTTSWIKETHASGDLHIQGKEIALKMSNGENSAIFRENGAVELMHNAAKKIETTATGINVTGAITVGGTALTSGKVLQVKSMHTDTSTGSASVDWHATAVTLAITPSATSSKILVSFDGQMYVQNTSGDAGMAIKIQQAIAGGATTSPDALHSRSNVNYSAHYTQQTYGQFNIRIPLSGLVAPNTTAEITYKLYFIPYNVNGAGINAQGGRSTLTLMEIAG